MSYSNNIISTCENVCSEAQNLNSYISSEAYDGKWKDEVGASYVSYTEKLVYVADRLRTFANDVRIAEENINSLDESADKSKLENLKSRMGRL